MKIKHKVKKFKWACFIWWKWKENMFVWWWILFD